MPPLPCSAPQRPYFHMQGGCGVETGRLTGRLETEKNARAARHRFSPPALRRPEHTGALLAEIGYDSEAIVRLRDARVV